MSDTIILQLFFFGELMILKQVELKKVEIKALVSMDKSMRLVFDVNLTPSSEADVAGVHSLLYKPLILEIKEDGQYNAS